MSSSQEDLSKMSVKVFYLLQVFTINQQNHEPLLWLLTKLKHLAFELLFTSFMLIPSSSCFLVLRVLSFKCHMRIVSDKDY